MEQKEYTPKCTCGKQVSGICNGQGDCPKMPVKPKELPQEPKELIESMADNIERTEDATYRELAVNCTQLAMAHYEPQLQAKDTTIKEQAQKIEKLTGLLKVLAKTHFYDKNRRLGFAPKEADGLARIDVDSYLQENNINP